MHAPIDDVTADSSTFRGLDKHTLVLNCISDAPRRGTVSPIQKVAQSSHWSEVLGLGVADFAIDKHIAIPLGTRAASTADDACEALTLGGNVVFEFMGVLSPKWVKQFDALMRSSWEAGDSPTAIDLARTAEALAQSHGDPQRAGHASSRIAEIQKSMQSRLNQRQRRYEELLRLIDTDPRENLAMKHSNCSACYNNALSIRYSQAVVEAHRIGISNEVIGSLETKMSAADAEAARSSHTPTAAELKAEVSYHKRLEAEAKARDSVSSSPEYDPRHPINFQDRLDRNSEELYQKWLEASYKRGYRKL